MADSRSEEIQKLNDTFRTSSAGGISVVTQGIQAQSPDTIRRIMQEVRTFDQFTPTNDLYGEHDLGAFELDQLKLLWKIDYYNLSMDGGSKNPADPKITKRVLTVMLREEY